LSNGTLWPNKSGSIKERTQKSTKIRTGCQRNAYWLATVRSWLVQPIKER